MSYKTCENCGERVYKLGCVNCDEQNYIDEQSYLDSLPDEYEAVPQFKLGDSFPKP